MGFVSWGFVVLACWLIDMSYWALKGSELPGACESFLEGVHGQKLLRGSKNVSIGRFCIGEYDENRHHIFGCMHKFWPLRGPTLIWGGLSPPVVRARDNKNPNVFLSPTQRLGVMRADWRRDAIPFLSFLFLSLFPFSLYLSPLSLIFLALPLSSLFPSLSSLLLLSLLSLLFLYLSFSFLLL